MTENSIDRRSKELQEEQMKSTISEIHWDARIFIDDINNEAEGDCEHHSRKHRIGNYAVMVLNTVIVIPPKIVKNLWKNAHLRFTIDGGTNRWFTFLKKYCNSEEEKLNSPDFITGDFDSVLKEILDEFPKATKIHTPDQNETDFTKCLRILQPLVEENKISYVIVFHENRGRTDQIMANLNTLYKAEDILPNIPVVLLSGSSLTWLLRPGKHSICVPKYLVDGQCWCGLIPVGGKATVSSKGLKWDLNQQTLEFGKLVSTSNTYKSSSVKVITDNYLIWTMGVFNADCD